MLVALLAANYKSEFLFIRMRVIAHGMPNVPILICIELLIGDKNDGTMNIKAHNHL